MDKAKQNMQRVMERILAWCHTPQLQQPKSLKLPQLEWKTNPDGSRTCRIKRSPE